MYRCGQMTSNNRCNCTCNNKICNQNTSQNNKNNDDKNKCSCGFSESDVFPQNYMYGQSYVPIQYIDTTFRPEIGLKMGTIFPELVSPYEPGQSMMENAYLRSVTGNEGKCPSQQ